MVQLQVPVLAAADPGEAVASKSLLLRAVQIGTTWGGPEDTVRGLSRSGDCQMTGQRE